MAVVADRNYDSNCRARGADRKYLWTAGFCKNRAVSSKFVWVTGDIGSEVEHQMTYTNWWGGAPNNYRLRNEQCVELWPNLDYVWNDEVCSEEYCFICENQ